MSLGLQSPASTEAPSSFPCLGLASSRTCGDGWKLLLWSAPWILQQPASWSLPYTASPALPAASAEPCCSGQCFGAELEVGALLGYLSTYTCRAVVVEGLGSEICLAKPLCTLKPGEAHGDLGVGVGCKDRRSDSS